MKAALCALASGRAPSLTRAAAALACAALTMAGPNAARPALASGTTATAPAPDSAPRKVRIGTSGAYPPYDFTTEAGRLDGFDLELGKALCKRAGLTCTWQTAPRGRLRDSLAAGKFDAAMSGLVIPDDDDSGDGIDPVTLYSRPYLPAPVSAYAVSRKGAPLDGIVACVPGSVQGVYIARSNGTLAEFPTPARAATAVREGEADAMLADRAVLARLMAESGNRLMVAGKPVKLGQGIAIALRPDEPRLKAKFDAGIEAMEADGSLKVMIARWFGPGPAPQKARQETGQKE